MRLILALTLLATPALANDGFGGLTATGLTFGKTADIAMEDEDLFISPTKVRVAYTFRNLTDHDVAGEIIFPLPPINLADLEYESFNLPDDPGADNLINFTATVAGKPVAVQIDRIAVIEPEDQGDRPLAATYDTPGRDVTDLLKAQNIPLTLDNTALAKQLASLPPDIRQTLVDQGLISTGDDGDGGTELLPLWSIVLRYHWSQTFPANATLNISHAYDNRPSGGIFTWTDPPTEDYDLTLAKTYCIDSGTSKAILKAVHHKESDGSDADYGSSFNIAYVLRTANSWASPIGHFKLTLDKGDLKNVISLCADGITKTGPTTFEWQKDDFAPDHDLQILVVTPLNAE